MTNSIEQDGRKIHSGTMSPERGKLFSNVDLVTAGIAVAGLMPVAPNPAGAQVFGPPAYTMAERDRRWAVVRTMMREQGLDVLVVPHGAGADFRIFNTPGMKFHRL